MKTIICKKCKNALRSGRRYVNCPRQGRINARGPDSANAQTPWWRGDGECELFGDEKKEGGAK